MRSEHQRTTDELDPARVKVHLSSHARKAFRDLAAAVHFSDHFSGDILSVVNDLAEGKALSVGDMLAAIPSIASETFRHIHATDDQRAADAWRAVGEGFTEHEITLRRERSRQR